jgi:hypothetical protein
MPHRCHRRPEPLPLLEPDDASLPSMTIDERQGDSYRKAPRSCRRMLFTMEDDEDARMA